ncbi:uncharacterized protein LOC126045078 [Accipiter gentilis]|uniref:uncharacterized protein LOC126045078 n=1 Tax=Astur gentilis TaxID=8957 RepID=UPI002110072A|nr:uncharacterized protein LOC126045078 [Accipiter gentilis]
MDVRENVGVIDSVPSRVEGIEKLYDLLEDYRSCPLVQGQDWAKNHWFQPQSVVDQIRILQKEAKVKKGKGKAIICAVLGASLAAAMEERKQKSGQGDMIRSLQEQLQESKQFLEEERNLVKVLTRELKKYMMRETKRETEVETLPSEKRTQQIYPQGDLQRAKETIESCPHVCPVIKTEYVYEDSSDDRPQVITKEAPYTATELAKLRKDFSRMAKESETEYVWRVSLTGGDGILLSEKEAEGYWGPGVFLTTGDHRAPWSLTQRAAYWAGGLNAMERGDPLAITGTVDQLVESVQKAACIQMMYDRELKPHQGSPMTLPVVPERMSILIRGLPDSLRPVGIQLRGTILNTLNGERSRSTLEGRMSPDHRRPGRKVWTWGEVAQELIDFERKFGPVSGPSQRTENKIVRRLSGRLLAPGRQRPLSRQALWQLGLQKGIQRDLMDGLSTQRLEELVQNWSGQKAISKHLQGLKHECLKSYII